MLLLGTSRYYPFPATTTGGPPKQTTASGSHPETRRFPAGTTNRRPATEVVLQRNPPPFREEARQLVTPRLGPTPECPRARHTHTIIDSALSAVVGESGVHKFTPR